jgi:ParB family chromosome partitioning protein
MLLKFSQIIPPADDDPSDSRRTGRRDGMKGLKASLMHHGLLQGLLVRPQGKRHAIVDGRRRYWAFSELIADGELPKNFELTCTQVGDDVSSLDASLAANTQRAPLHPVDEYEDFAALVVQEGATTTDIAKRYGRPRDGAGEARNMLRGG